MGLLPVLCVWGLHRRRHPKGRVHGSRHKRLVPLPTAVMEAQRKEQRSAVSRLVPSRTQEQVSELENLLREGLGKGGNGVPGDATGRWQWLQQGKLSPEDHSSLTGIGTIRTRFHGSLPTQVPAEDLGGGMPHPWGCRERVGSGSGVGGPAGRLTMSGEIQGRCVRSFVLLTDCQAAFQIWLSLPGRFNTSWLCAP